jgi:hypothetical protein
MQTLYIIPALIEVSAMRFPPFHFLYAAGSSLSQ